MPVLVRSKKLLGDLPPPTGSVVGLRAALVEIHAAAIIEEDSFGFEQDSLELVGIRRTPPADSSARSQDPMPRDIAVIGKGKGASSRLLLSGCAQGPG